MFLSLGVLASCSSPMDVDTNRLETPIGKIPTVVVNQKHEINGLPVDFNLKASKIFIELSKNPHNVWIDSLHYDIEDAIASGPSGLKINSVELKLDKSQITLQDIVLPGSEKNYARFDLERTIGAKYDSIWNMHDSGYNESYVFFELNEAKEEILMTFKSKVVDVCSFDAIVIDSVYTEDPDNLDNKILTLHYRETSERLRDSLVVESEFTLKY